MKKSKLLLCIIMAMAVLCSCGSKDSEPAMENGMESGTESSENNTDLPVEIWQDAYKDIICDINNNLPDPYHSISNYDHLSEDWFYVGIHDFDKNGVPELIIGSVVSVAIFTCEEGRAEKVADLYEPEEWGGVNGLHYKDNHLVLESNGSDGSGYVCFTYEQGEYITGFYCDYHPGEVAINGKHVSGEEFLQQFDVCQLRKNSRIPYCKVNTENEILLTDSDEWIAIDDLDLGLVEW